MDNETNIRTDGQVAGVNKSVEPNTIRRGVPTGCHELMTIQQVMEASNFSRSFVDNAIKDGDLVTIKLARTHRIRVSEYNAWVFHLDQPKDQAA